jgi:uncharacterized damage-inducible protein DinB
MADLLNELYAHQAWADAEHWRAFESLAAALDDSQIRKRLFHIHVVQHAFLTIVRGERPAMPGPGDFESPRALKDYGRRFHGEAAALLRAIAPARLDELLEIPWFKDPPIRITVAQALTQAVMHSHYHRGQNATRFRELGGDPPVTDLIVWWWKGRPEPVWD